MEIGVGAVGYCKFLLGFQFLFLLQLLIYYHHHLIKVVQFIFQMRKFYFLMFHLFHLHYLIIFTFIHPQFNHLILHISIQNKPLAYFSHQFYPYSKPKHFSSPFICPLHLYHSILPSSLVIPWLLPSSLFSLLLSVQQPGILLWTLHSQCGPRGFFLRLRFNFFWVGV